ncbi:MAG: CBS domain-containing protein [Labilithrix sp.]|nr:CBS domain-containing protein [Labilithrix sp.]MCW5812569.1 CBS domain-containing protein [Labilithrix sp.]
MSPSLSAYRHARVIVQSRHATAVEAALAMKTNEIGCVLVSDGRSVVGLVTDRDLALRVVAEGRDPRATQLGDIMSTPVTSLDAKAPHADAIRLMRERNIRRVPLVEGRRVVGMATLDDLILEGAATPAELTAVVEAQIAEGGPARTRRFDEWTSLKRRHSRALGTKAKLLARIRDRAGVETNDQAERALDVVLESIVRGLPPGLAASYIARLPVALRSRLRELDPASAACPSRKRLDARMARELGLERARASQITGVVVDALTDFVHATDPIGRRLPEGVRAILAPGG